MTDRYSRREFVKKAALGTLALAIAPSLKAAESSIPRRKFGETGMEVSILGLGGGSALLAASEADRVKIIEKALELGVNYFDTAESYGKERASEKLYGQVLPAHRSKIYITSKSEDRTHDGVMRSVEASLKALKTDHLDVLHVHAVGKKDEPANWGKPDGVVTALRKLRDQKVIRSMALSGHESPEKLKEAIEMYDFNSVLMALNASKNKAFREVALPAAAKKNMGIVAMKTTRGLVGEGEGKANARQLLGWAWSQPVHVAIVGMTTLQNLEENVSLAKAYKANPAEEEKLTAALAPVVTDEQLVWAMPGYRDGYGIIA